MRATRSAHLIRFRAIVLIIIHSIGMCRTWRFLAVLRTFFHSSLLCTFPCHPSLPTILPSSLTLSCHIFLGLPLNLVVPKFIYAYCLAPLLTIPTRVHRCRTQFIVAGPSSLLQDPVHRCRTQFIVAGPSSSLQDPVHCYRTQFIVAGPSSSLQDPVHRCRTQLIVAGPSSSFQDPVHCCRTQFIVVGPSSLLQDPVQRCRI